MNLKYLWVLSVLLSTPLLYAQNLSGKIISKIDQQPLDGAHILTNNGLATYTNFDGDFVVKNVEENVILTISYVGYKTIQQQVLDINTPIVITLQEAPIAINGVLVTGNMKIDPVLTLETNDYVKKIVQPRNVADLFNDVNGFSLIKRGNYAIDPSFRATQYEQLNVQFDGGTKAMNACPNRMDPITTHVIPEEIEKIEADVLSGA